MRNSQGSFFVGIILLEKQIIKIPADAQLEVNHLLSLRD